jgi:hypothetical protein
MTDSKTLKNQSLLQEYIELKRQNSEIPALSQKTSLLYSEISDLSLKVSELEAKLSAKESDLKKSNLKFPSDIDTQIKILESENSKLKELTTLQQNEIWKNEISQNLQFKSIYETSFKEILEKFYSKGNETPIASLSSPLEAEKNKLQMQLKKQEILLQEAVNERNYIKNEVLPVLEHTLHLYEKNKLELDNDIENLETKLKAPVQKKNDNIIYEEDEFDLNVGTRETRDHCEAFSPKQSLQYSFVSANNISARPSISKVAMPSPRGGKFMATQIKTKRIGKF